MSGALHSQDVPHWEALAREAAQPAGTGPVADRREFVQLRLAGDPYAIPMEAVREIVRLRPITPMPRVTPAVRGVIALRGEMVQVVDLRLRLGLAVAEPDRSTRIIVLRSEEGVTGLLVDSVREVLRADAESLRPPPQGEGEMVSALCERDGEFVSVIDLERVLDLGHVR